MHNVTRAWFELLYINEKVENLLDISTILSENILLTLRAEKVKEMLKCSQIDFCRQIWTNCKFFAEQILRVAMCNVLKGLFFRWQFLGTGRRTYRLCFLLLLCGFWGTVLGCGGDGGASSLLVGSEIKEPMNKGIKTVVLPKAIEGMNSLSLQIRLSNIPENLNTQTFLACGVNPPGEDHPWVISNGIKIPGGVMLYTKGYFVQPVLPFSSLDFDPPIPVGTTVEIINGSTREALASLTIVLPE